MFSFLAKVLYSIILAQLHTVLYYVLCLQPHSVYKSYPSDLFPTGLAEIIGQSSIYVEHLPPPPSFDAAFFLRE